jgi:hypothetical protein
MKKNLRNLPNPVLLLLAIGGIFLHSAFATDTCPPPGYTELQLLEIKQLGFKVEDAAQRNEVAISLLQCIGHPDPHIRDGIVYEGIATWLRGNELSPETIDSLYDRLLPLIKDENDKNGFQQPFAALILSEVARTDRIGDTFSLDKRAEIVEVAAKYLSQVKDYRGFSETEGWRHGVAHGADLVLQLVLNKNINAEQVASLLAAVSVQVSPPGEVFYIYGEPARLARAVFYAQRRAVLDESSWKAWLDEIADPRPLQNWNNAYSSQQGLAKRHNTLTFLQALFLYANSSGDEQGKVFAEQVMSAITQIL